LGAIINVGIEVVVVGAADSWVGATQLLPHGEYYHYKASRLQLITGCMAEESQALLNQYVSKTGIRQHLATATA
jgi:tRNA(adenine34) deaminase